MTTKLAVTQIADPDTNVTVNCGEHRIEEIKSEIKNCEFCPMKECKINVLQMWKE